MSSSQRWRRVARWRATVAAGSQRQSAVRSARRGDAVGAVATAAARRATHAASPAASHPAWLSGERDMACARTDDAVWVVNAAIAFVALNQIESGKTPDPGVSRIIGIARVLGVSTDALLLGGKDEDATLPAPPPSEAPAAAQSRVSGIGRSYIANAIRSRSTHGDGARDWDSLTPSHNTL